MAAKLIAPPRPFPARSDRDDPPGRSWPRINSTFGSIAFLAIVVVLWIVSLARLQLTAIGAYGLVSALPVTMFLGLALLVVSMVMAIHRGERSAILAAHLVLFILIVHATPALLYTTLRYAWAWKHLGLVDYLTRHHAVTHQGGDLSVYQNWPGFFTASTSWLVGSGLSPSSWPTMAQWAPPAFELLFSFCVLAFLSSVEADRRLVWLSVWFFAIGNWVGQDYFSPQAYAYLLYLAVLVVVFRWLARKPPMPIFLRGFVRDWPDPEETDDTRESSHEQTRAATIIALLCVTAIATSHPLTPLVLFVALCALALTRVLRVRSLPLLAAVPTFLWLEVGARSYTNAEVPGLVTKVGALDQNVSQTLTKAANAAASQRLVSTLGRAEVAFLVLLAGIGLVRRIRNGHWDLGMIVLAVIPGTILVGGSYGGEAVFRVYLFALPFLAYFAAAAFYPTKELVRGRSRWLAFVSCIVVVTTFLFSYYGKEAWSYFAPGEVRAAKLIFDNAKPNSVIVEGTADFPTHFANYTDFSYVDISNEPPSSFTRILANPVGDLRNWLADPAFKHSYLIITAAMKAQTDALGSLPVGSLQRIEDALRKSPVFHVLYYDRDAVVFELASASRTQVPTPLPTPNPNPKK